MDLSGGQIGIFGHPRLSGDIPRPRPLLLSLQAIGLTRRIGSKTFSGITVFIEFVMEVIGFGHIEKNRNEGDRSLSGFEIGGGQNRTIFEPKRMDIIKYGTSRKTSTVTKGRIRMEGVSGESIRKSLFSQSVQLLPTSGVYPGLRIQAD